MHTHRTSRDQTKYRWRHVLLALTLWTTAGASFAAESLPELVELGEREAALRALEDGADVEARGPDGATALLWAAHRGDRELVAALLARDANPDAANDYGVTPLAAAAVEADAEIVGALLEAGADVESPNAEGQTALMIVARSGRVDAARALIEHGARVNAHENFGGQTALMWAAAQKHPDMLRLLLDNGAAVNARGTAHDWERRVTAEPRIKIMQTGGFTPLLYAAREGCAACVEPLVAGGADVELWDPYGMTPLVLALYNRQFDTAVEAHRARRRCESMGLVGAKPAVSRDRAEPLSPTAAAAICRRSTSIRASTSRACCSRAGPTSTCA